MLNMLVRAPRIDTDADMTVIGSANQMKEKYNFMT